MADVTLAPAKLLLAQRIRSDEGGTTAYFADGQVGHLAATQSHYAYGAHLLERSLQLQAPVGVALEADGSISRVYRAHEDRVKELGPEHETPVTLFFWGHAGLYRLEHDRPDFRRLWQTLLRAEQEQTWVWFVSRLSPLVLLDVIPSTLRHDPETKGVSA